MLSHEKPIRRRLAALTPFVLLLSVSPSLAQGASGATSGAEVEALRGRLADAERELEALQRRLEESGTNAVIWEPGPLPGQVALERLGLFAKARVGITLETEPEARQDAAGAVVRDVVPDGPADRAGLEARDVITHWNGTAIRAQDRDFFGRVSYNEHLLELARRLDPGDEVELRILRGDTTRTLTVVAEAAPPPLVASTFTAPRAQLDAVRALESARAAASPRWNLVLGLPGNSLLGEIEMVPVDPVLGEYFDTDRGLLVLKTPEGDGFGLRAGDVLLSIGDREPRDTTHALRILRSYDPGEEVNLHVVRKGERITLSAEVPAPERSGAFPAVGAILDLPSL